MKYSDETIHSISWFYFHTACDVATICRRFNCSPAVVTRAIKTVRPTHDERPPQPTQHPGPV